MNLNLPELLALGLMGAALLMSLLRLLAGPTAPDRVVSADTLAVISTVLLAGVAARFANPIYLDVALIYGALAFVGVVAIARAIEGNRG